MTIAACRSPDAHVRTGRMDVEVHSTATLNGHRHFFAVDESGRREPVEAPPANRRGLWFTPRQADAVPLPQDVFLRFTTPGATGNSGPTAD